MPPAAAIGAMVGGSTALGLGAAGGAAAAGVGKSNASSKNFTETNAYDANRYELGGRPGGADELAGHMRGRGNAYEDRTNKMMHEADIDRGMADGARNLALGARDLQWGSRDLSLDARNRQAQAQNLMIDRARGNNLVSTKVAERGRTDLGSRLQSMAASARGPAALANAQSDAMAAQAQGLGSINAQEQIASQQEQMAAEQAAFGAASGMREGDTALRSGDFALRAGDDNMRAMDLTQRGQSLNSAGQMAGIGVQYSGLENDARKAQLNAGIEQQKIAAGSQQHSDTLNTGTNIHNADQDMNYLKMGLGAVAGGAQAGTAAASGLGAPAATGPKIPPTSDPLAKTSILGLGSPSPAGAAGPSGGSSYALGGDASLDVGGTLEANSKFATQFQSDPTGGMSGGGLLSDPKAKTDVVPLADMPGKRLQIGDDDRAFYASESPDDGRPSLAGPTPRFSKAADLSIDTQPRAKAAPRAMTHDELLAAANAMGSSMRSDHNARMASGPAARRLSGGSPENSYTTELTPGAEKAYQDWRGRTAPWDSGEDYDLRGAFADGTDRDGRGHLPDTYKKPNHETFSNESTYAQYAPERAGRWEGERYFPPASDPKAKKEAFQMGVEVGAAQMETESPPEHIPPAVHPLPPPPPPPMMSPYKDEGTRAPVEVDMAPAPRERPKLALPDLRSMLAARVSDPRAKELGGVHDNEIAKTLDATPAVSYKYKDEAFEPEAARPGERQAGFLTSDLKKTPLGAAVVEKRPDGLEGYNEHRLNGLQHAEIRNLHERLRELESMLAGGRRGR